MKFEFDALYFRDDFAEKVLDDLNARGAEGWDAAKVALTHRLQSYTSVPPKPAEDRFTGVVFLKRAIVEEAPLPAFEPAAPEVPEAAPPAPKKPKGKRANKKAAKSVAVEPPIEPAPE